MSKISIVFSFAFCILLFYQVNAQKEENLLLMEVKLWKADGDTIIGLFEYINNYSIQYNIALTDTVEDSYRYYSPRDITGFYFYTKDEKIVYHGLENPLSSGYVFLKLIYQGEYSVYHYIELDQGTSYLSFTTHCFLWKDSWLEPEISKAFEKEALLKHFSDCPEVKFKIKTGEYNMKSIIDLIKEYEKCELTDDYEFFYE